jgi:ankyrin repeat protein
VALFNKAIETGNVDLIHAFLLAKAPIVAPNPRDSPICAASQAGGLDLVTQLLATRPPYSKLPAQIIDECLSRAALSGSVPLVDLWLNRGAHPTPLPRPAQSDEDTVETSSPLLNAITGGNPEVVARLLAAHADITSQHNNGRSLISFALSRVGDESVHDPTVRIVHLLLDAGADVNEETEMDRAALYEVSDAAELVPDIVAAGANVNLRNSQGETPLMYASSTEAIKALLAAGADPTIRSSDGKTAAEEARRWSCSPQCAALIEQAIAERTQNAAPSP